MTVAPSVNTPAICAAAICAEVNRRLTIEEVRSGKGSIIDGKTVF